MTWWMDKMEQKIPEHTAGEDLLVKQGHRKWCMTAKHAMWARLIDNTEHAVSSALTVCLNNFWDRSSFLYVPLHRWT